MKNSRLTLIIGLLSLINVCFGQLITESNQPLTGKAQKGYLDDVSFDANGNINVLYKIGGDKKKKELFFESYAFDKDLKFIESKSANEPKVESKPDKEQKYLKAWVGGKTSFDILSMKLRVNLRTVKMVWNAKKQRYERDEVISDETVKLKNEEGRAYFGVDQFWNDETNTVVIIAYTETKDKNNPKNYVLLNINFDGDVTEKPVDINGAYSMVMTSELPADANGKQEFMMVLAPKEKAPDVTKYVMLRYDMNMNLKNKVEFKSPANALLVNSVDVKDGDIYISALSRKGASYEDIFDDYAPLDNPYYTGAQNYQMDKYYKRAGGEMTHFHLLKFSGDKMVFASTASVDDFKTKKKLAPGEKGGKLFTGRKFLVADFKVTPNNEYLVAGQSMSWAMLGGNFTTTYGDVVCLHFDANGQLKAQYAVDRIFEDKKSEIFSMPQSFYMSADGKSAYWEIMEVKGYSGYDNFWDAYNGVKTYRPRYFPRITKIDLQTASLTEFKYPGNKKFFLYRDGQFFNKETSTATYVGRDEDHETLWVGKIAYN